MHAQQPPSEKLQPPQVARERGRRNAAAKKLTIQKSNTAPVHVNDPNSNHGGATKKNRMRRYHI